MNFSKKPGVSFLVIIFSAFSFIHEKLCVCTRRWEGGLCFVADNPSYCSGMSFSRLCETLYIISNAVEPIQIPAFPVYHIFGTSRKTVGYSKESVSYNTMKS